MKESAAMSPERQKQIGSLLQNRELFNDFVYMSVTDAIEELERRQTALDKNLADRLDMDAPESMRQRKSAVLFRHIATPNYEIRRFMMAGDVLRSLGIEPLILEYLDDKFTNRNEWKYYLGRLSAYKGQNKKDESIFECRVIIDFITNDMKPLSSIKTLWGESLVDMHHRLFLHDFPGMDGNIFDMSKWLREHGQSARDYYKSFLRLFIKHGILFENFLISGKELKFTENVVLPALLDIYEETGFKPIIVALEPTHLEEDQFWLSHFYKKNGFFEDLIGQP